MMTVAIRASREADRQIALLCTGATMRMEKSIKEALDMRWSKIEKDWSLDTELTPLQRSSFSLHSYSVSFWVSIKP